jgi:hypothetical protein
MAPRAAVRLEQLGFPEVYRYLLGKTGWLASGQPYEGDPPGRPLAGEHLREVAACDYRAPLDQAQARIHDGMCVAVDDQGVVVGRLRRDATEREDGSVADVMEPGPVTIRASEPLEEITHRMHHANVKQILVTDALGRLLGLLDRDEADAVLERLEAVEEQADGLGHG